jgi:hypothetical protein
VISFVCFAFHLSQRQRPGGGRRLLVPAPSDRPDRAEPLATHTPDNSWPRRRAASWARRSWPSDCGGGGGRELLREDCLHSLVNFGNKLLHLARSRLARSFGAHTNDPGRRHDATAVRSHELIHIVYGRLYSSPRTKRDDCVNRR